MKWKKRPPPSRRNGLAILCCVPLLLALTANCFADAWTLTTADFQSRTILLHGLDDHGIAITTASQPNAQTVPLDRLLELSRVVPLRPRPAAFVLRMRDHDLIVGEPVSLSGDSIIWREDITGATTIPLRQAESFRRWELAEGHASTIASDDVAMLANGDSVHGVLSDLTNSSVSIQPAAGGDATVIPLASVNSVQFAEVQTSTTQPSAVTPAFRVHLTDGSVLTAHGVHGDEWTLHLTLSDSTMRDVPVSTIQSIEQIDGPVAWLSSRAPAENVQIPFLGSEIPARFDRSVMGGPITFGDHVYQHGIGVHAYSRMSWPVMPGDLRFRAQYAIDGDSPNATVTVRIKLDNQIVHEQKDFRANTLSPVIELDVTGKHTLMLEVADPENAGVQARLNWIEPAFLRTPAPPTQP